MEGDDTPNGTPATVVDLSRMADLVGSHVGFSQWHEVTQEQVNGFAEATLDYQWLHVDVERARTGPFGGCIAHGYLTLSLGPRLLEDILEVQGSSRTLNYGLNRVRFPTPVAVGSRVRLGAELASVEEVTGSLQAVFSFTFEVEGHEKPACFAEAVFRYYP